MVLARCNQHGADLSYTFQDDGKTYVTWYKVVKCAEWTERTDWDKEERQQFMVTKGCQDEAEKKF